MARSPAQGLLTRPTAPRGGLFRFFSETLGELRKAVWPTREEVMRLTFIVLVIAGIIGVILGTLDFFYTQTVTRFLFR